MLIDLNQPWPYLATAAVVGLLGRCAWSQNRRPRNHYFFWIVGVWLVWALSAGFTTLVPTPELRSGMWVLQAFFLLLASLLELMFSLVYTGNEKYLNRRDQALLVLPVLLFGLLTIALPRNYLVSIEMRAGVELLAPNPLVKYGILAYGLGAWLTGMFVLFGSLLRAPAFRASIGLIILGQAIPRIAFLASSLLQETGTSMQVAILFSTFSALAYLIGLYHFRFLRVIPVARDKVIYHMPYAMLVLDAENYLVDFNPAAQALPGLPGELALGQAPGAVLGEWWERISPLAGLEPATQDITVQTCGGQQIFHVAGRPLLTGGWRVGGVFVLEDVTQARQAQRLQSQALWAQATLQEREQLAQELHDGLSQSLAFLNLQAQAAQVQVEAGQLQAAQENLCRLTEAAVNIQDETRQLIGSLLSVNLPAENFCAALGQILAGFERQTGLVTCLEMKPGTAAFFEPARLPPPAAVQLVRITQEALTNVRKHARGASRVSVQLKAGDGRVWITIRDDGPGFDPANQRTGWKCFGLQVMRQRAERIGAQISIDSAPGKGTHLEICVPLANG